MIALIDLASEEHAEGEDTRGSIVLDVMRKSSVVERVNTLTASLSHCLCPGTGPLLFHQLDIAELAQ